MSPTKDECDAAEVSRLLAGAAKAIASVRYCWLLTAAQSGDAAARPMGLLRRDPENEWTIRSVTDGRSRKAQDIRRSGKVKVIFQRDADDVYVTLAGTARLREGASEVRRRWNNAFNVYFPTEEDRASAAFVEIDAERLELWIRGVTLEPFGLYPTILERDASGNWRLVERDRSAA